MAVVLPRSVKEFSREYKENLNKVVRENTRLVFEAAEGGILVMLVCRNQPEWFEALDWIKHKNITGSVGVVMIGGVDNREHVLLVDYSDLIYPEQ